MGVFANHEGVLLLDTAGEHIGNVLSIDVVPSTGKTQVIVDLFVKPEATPTEELFHDENTMAKVILALYATGLNFKDAGTVIDTILDKGVVFREIVKPAKVV